MFTNDLIFSGDPKKDFNVWKTITLGPPWDKYKLRQIAVDKCLYLTDEAFYLTKKRAFRMSTEEKTINLVKLTLEDLGIHQGNYPDVVQVGLDLGLKLCPFEAIFQLYAQVEEMCTENMFLQFAMKPLTGPYGKGWVLAHERSASIQGYPIENQESWLRTKDSNCGLFMRGATFVFVLP